MSDYKLVPVEPTAEMMASGGIEIGARDEDARTVWKAMLAVAPAVQGELVAWVTADTVDGQTVNGKPRRIWWENNEGVGMPIYTAPQPSEQQPDKAVACPEGYMMVPAKEFESVLNRADWRTAKNRAELRHMLKSPQALAAPAVQGEPVAWQLRTPEGRVILNKEFPAWADGGDGYKITPLYTAPQPAEQQPCPEDIREGA